MEQADSRLQPLQGWPDQSNKAIAPTPAPKSALIAVVGMTGSGKSTFIQHLTGQVVRIGHSLHSETSSIQEVHFKLGGRDVTLVDTPGFDDTILSDTEVLTILANWLQASFVEGTRLSGIIYIHPITEVRIGNTSTRNIKLFRKLCGDDNLGNVVLLTNKWEVCDKNTAERRFQELTFDGKFWKKLIDLGASAHRYHNDSVQAEILVKMVLEKQPTALSIQRQLVVERKKFIDTDMGCLLSRMITRLKAHHCLDISLVQRKLKQANQREDQELKRQLEKATKKLRQAQQYERQLKAQVTIRKDDAIIVAMGLTGSGKSTFISRLVGEDKLVIGNSLESCTRDVECFRFQHPSGRHVILVDTPGFDDTALSDQEVLKKICGFLANIYKNKIDVAGVIYMHRITDTRLTGSGLRNLQLLKQLCGDKFYPQVALVTTMWERLEEGLELRRGECRETELSSTHGWWGDIYEKGGKLLRHRNTQESALRIISTLIQTKCQTALAIQHELVDEHRDLINTAAGQGIKKALEQDIKRYEEGSELLSAEIDSTMDANDWETADLLREQAKRYVEMTDRGRKHEKDLHATWEQLVEESERNHKLMIEEPQELDQASLIQYERRNEQLRTTNPHRGRQRDQGDTTQQDRDRDRHTRPSIVTSPYSSPAPINRLYSFSASQFESKLKQLVKWQVAEMDNLESIQQVKELETELLYSRPQDIALCPERNASRLGNIVRFAERLLPNDWDWWPLHSPQIVAPAGSAVLKWTCICGDPRRGVVPETFARDVIQLGKQTMAGSSAPASIPMGTITGSSGATPNMAPTQHQHTHHQNTGQSTTSNPTGPVVSNGSSVAVNIPSTSRYVMFMVESDTLHLAVIESQSLCNERLFARLRSEYRQMKGWIKSWFGLMTFSHCDFYKFEIWTHGRYCERGRGIPPTGDKSYYYQPRPMDNEPPISKHEFYDRFYKRVPSESCMATRGGSSFWNSRQTWKRASVNTTRCLIGCTLGDFTAMWLLQAYYPDLSMGIVMPISMASGISSSILLETVMLRIGRDGLSWLTAARTAIGMSLISMLTMEAAENAVDYYLTGGQVALNDPAFWIAALVSIAAGFIAPLPYNYARLRKYGKACH
ncbi:hypothetical protein FSARC_5473 [Fusarium sarcochroum]|uniref:G domain-containing protein n=1 Tax=Fusarium sarcochroum TaxID=1208366 RepID=A0A8H4TZS2_9HYPO|nr:hypothetical protein FSARC_5473 [Fusarium sarcochroum]